MSNDIFCLQGQNAKGLLKRNKKSYLQSTLYVSNLNRKNAEHALLYIT